MGLPTLPFKKIFLNVILLLISRTCGFLSFTYPRPGIMRSCRTKVFSISTDDPLERKNALRRKYGLKPITREEFFEIEEKVRNLSDETLQTWAEENSSRERNSQLSKSESGNVFSDVLNGIFCSTCQSNFDCERPEVCCDLIFKKVCCSSGEGVMDARYAPVPVPVNIVN